MKWMLELAWWLATLLLLTMVMFPLYSYMPEYPYWTPNVVFIVVFVTAARHIFLLRHSLMPRNPVFKVTLIFLCIPLIGYMVQHLNGFQSFLDGLTVQDWNRYFGDIGQSGQLRLRNYVRTEMVFFGTAAIISCIILPIRLVISIWRTRNLGTV